MSKNAANKRRLKAIHRDQWSRLPKGTPLAFVIRDVVPQRTPLMELESIMLRNMDEAAADTRAKYVDGR